MISVFYGVVCSVVALMSFLPAGATNPCSAFQNYCKVSTHQAVDAASQQMYYQANFSSQSDVVHHVEPGTNKGMTCSAATETPLLKLYKFTDLAKMYGS